MSFRAWGFKTNLVYARSITAAQVNAVQPVGLANGGSQWMVYNSGTVPVLFYAYENAKGTPTLTFPVDAAPPVGSLGTVIPPGARVLVSANVRADSFAAIGQAAGPSVIYVQRGDGST